VGPQHPTAALLLEVATDAELRSAQAADAGLDRRTDRVRADVHESRRAICAHGDTDGEREAVRPDEGQDRARVRRPQLVEALVPGDVGYTAYVDEAIAAVDEGRAEAAFLLRPTRIEDVFAVARRGEVLPPKTTYFYPKLLSGLLFHPL
jgi:hypothetical protein